MGPATQVVSPGAALLACAGLAAFLLVAGWLLVAVRRRRAALDAELARSRDEVVSLSRKVEELADEVVRARRSAEIDREYVITSLAGDQVVAAPPAGNAAEQLARGPARPPVGRLVEERLVDALSRTPQDSPVRVRAVELVVRAVSVGHGLRRALSPDVLDRAAAEAHVARRRSRRQRRREIRRARQLVRALDASHRNDQSRDDQDVA